MNTLDEKFSLKYNYLKIIYISLSFLYYNEKFFILIYFKPLRCFTIPI